MTGTGNADRRLNGLTSFIKYPALFDSHYWVPFHYACSLLPFYLFLSNFHQTNVLLCIALTVIHNLWARRAHWLKFSGAYWGALILIHTYSPHSPFAAFIIKLVCPDVVLLGFVGQLTLLKVKVTDFATFQVAASSKPRKVTQQAPRPPSILSWCRLSDRSPAYAFSPYASTIRSRSEIR